MTIRKHPCPGLISDPICVCFCCPGMGESGVASIGTKHVFPLFQDIKDALHRYEPLSLPQAGRQGLGGAAVTKVKPSCPYRIQDVKLQPPEVVPMELRTVCRVPGLVETLQRFRGGTRGFRQMGDPGRVLWSTCEA